MTGAGGRTHGGYTPPRSKQGRTDVCILCVTFRTEHDVWRFFADRDAKTECGTEPDWEQHLAVIRASRNRGAAGT